MANTPSYFAVGSSEVCCVPQIAVAAGLEADMARLQLRARGPRLNIDGAERRAAIAGDEARRVAPSRDIARPLQQRQPHQRLRAGQIHPLDIDPILVVQRDRGLLHARRSLWTD